MDSFDFIKYINMALRWKYWIIIPFLLSVLGGLGYLLKTPKIYEARTLILVQSQKVPEDFVRTIISSDIDARLRIITEQVTSRTNLEKILEQYRLYRDSGSVFNIDDRVALLRERIKINVNTGGRGKEASSFTIAFKGEDPRIITQVTNALASNFISENLRIRESQALGTSAFLADELESIRKQLAKKEETLKEYRQRYMGAMPGTLQTNLSILGRLQMQLEQLGSNLMDAENRKLIIQKQIADSEMMQKQMAESGRERLPIELESSPPSRDEASGELLSLKKQLDLLESRYTANHPDVIRMKKVISKMEAEESGAEVEVVEPEIKRARPETGFAGQGPAGPTIGDLLRPQLQQIHFDIKKINEEISKAKSLMEMYQHRVEETPKREQELLSLSRDYENLKSLYNSMLSRKLEAEIAVSMEKKQKGEQFRVIDPAKIPVRPVEPDARKIILMALALGLGLGCGLVYLKDFMDTSYKVPEDLEKELQLPVLMSVPIRYTERELKKIKRRKILGAASVAVGFALSAAGIVLGIKGVDATLGFIRNILDRM